MGRRGGGGARTLENSPHPSPSREGNTFYPTSFPFRSWLKLQACMLKIPQNLCPPPLARLNPPPPFFFVGVKLHLPSLVLHFGAGGSPCRLSILRNANVACLCRLFMPMSHVEFNGPRPLNSTRRYGLFLKSTCDMSLGDIWDREVKKIVTCDMIIS